jgi:predicted ATPase/DNA-binding SARP family transcriptional activator
VEFRILGPLQVCEGSAVVPLGGERQRTLLAILLAYANEVISSDRLCEELWQGRLPRTAETALQVQVSHLRKILEPNHTPGSPYSVLVTEPPGYVLRVDPDDFDLHRFQRLRQEGREALAGHRPTAASRALREALALWRGPAFGDVSFQPALQHTIAMLEDQRLAVLEDRIEADLALGRHQDLVGELEALSNEYPLRERPRSLLMLALYRSGRQAEALAAYRQARQTLSEELGIDPSPALVTLERAILTQDPSLDLDATAGAAKTNVPLPANPLVGRERELTATCALLQRPEVRLLTLTGAGGSGKSRLALEIAQIAGEAFESGVFLVRLGRISDPALVVPTIARTLAVGERADEPVLETLARHLRDNELLLLLDNFEHLLSAAPVITRLVEAAAGLKVLVTSRSPLRLLGEHEYPVAPLSLPDPADSADRSAMSGSEAVALFIQRASAVKPDFELTDLNLPAIAEICIRLDGLPLALELAAARCRLLSPEAIVDRLEHRLTLLTDGPRDVPARQQTLRDTIAWSHALLTDAEQHLFAHLGLFAGGCTAAAVEAVSGKGEVGDVFDGLASLLDKSLLLRQRDGDGEPRFAMLNTICEYARDELEKSGQAEAARTRHADWYLDLAERADSELRGAQQGVWLARLECEHDNLRAALLWARESSDDERRLRLAAALARFWSVHGYLTEGRHWLEESLTADNRLRPAPRAKALHGAFVLAHRQRDLKSAKAYSNESLVLCRRMNDKAGIARSLIYVGLVASAEGQYELAEARLAEAATLARDIGDMWTVAASISNQGDLELTRGAYLRARELSGESLALQRELGDARGIAISLNNIAYAALYQGHYRDALEPLQESLRIAFELQDRDGIAYRLEALAVVAAAEDETERAARLLGGADALFEVIGADLDPAEHAMHDRTVADICARLGEEAFAREWAAGRAMGLDEAVAYARQRNLAPA